jgi:hypothetical protein
MRRIGVSVTVAVVLGGCGHTPAPEPAGGAVSSTAASASPAGPPWYSITGDAPEIPGAVLVTTEPQLSLIRFDDERRLDRSWLYTGTVTGADVTIDRASPATAVVGEIPEWERAGRQEGHLVVRLPGPGDGGLAVLPRDERGKVNPAVRVHACSGNAWVSVLTQVDGTISDEAGLKAHAPELMAAVGAVLDDLRPR